MPASVRWFSPAAASDSETPAAAATSRTETSRPQTAATRARSRTAPIRSSRAMSELNSAGGTLESRGAGPPGAPPSSACRTSSSAKSGTPSERPANCWISLCEKPLPAVSLVTSSRVVSDSSRWRVIWMIPLSTASGTAASGREVSRIRIRCRPTRPPMRSRSSTELGSSQWRSSTMSSVGDRCTTAQSHAVSVSKIACFSSTPLSSTAEGFAGFERLISATSGGASSRGSSPRSAKDSSRRRKISSRDVSASRSSTRVRWSTIARRAVFW